MWKKSGPQYNPNPLDFKNSKKFSKRSLYQQLKNNRFLRHNIPGKMTENRRHCFHNPNLRSKNNAPMESKKKQGRYITCEQINCEQGIFHLFYSF